MPKHAATGRHRADVASKRPAETRFKDPIPATASKVANGPEMPIAVRAGATAVNRHRAPRAAYTSEERAAGRHSENVQPSGGSSGFSTRGSRTRYIRYVGNDEAGNVGKLVGEWLLGVLLISVTVPLQAGSNGYQKVMTSVMYRLTALTAVFFVLAIMSSGKAGKAAVYFGLIVDLGILFNAVRNGTVGNLGKVFAGTALTGTSGGTTPAADITNDSSAVAVAPGWGSGIPTSGGGGASNNPVPA